MNPNPHTSKEIFDDRLSKMFNEAEMEIVNLTNVQESVTDAISKIPDFLQFKPTVNVLLAVLIDYETPDGSNMLVWVSTKQKEVIRYGDLTPNGLITCLHSLQTPLQRPSLEGVGGQKEQYLKSD